MLLYTLVRLLETTTERLSFHKVPSPGILDPVGPTAVVTTTAEPVNVSTTLEPSRPPHCPYADSWIPLELGEYFLR